MAKLLSKIKDVFRKKDDTEKDSGSSEVKSSNNGPASPHFKPASSSSDKGNGSSGEKKTIGPASARFKPAGEPEKKPATPTFKSDDDFTRGGRDKLSDRARENGRRNGEDWTGASADQLRYNDLYYSTLDNPTHTRLYRDLEWSVGHGEYDSDYYKQNRSYLDEELKSIGDEFGEDSLEYRAMKQFIGDYEDMGRKAESRKAISEAEKASGDLDKTIDVVFSGIMAQKDFKDKVAEGEKALNKHPILKMRFNLDGASEKQRDLMYYALATGGEDAASELFDRFLGETINYQKAAKDFASDIQNDSELARFWEAAKAGAGQAFSGTGLRQTFTDTKADPTDRTILGDYSIDDSIDAFLKSQLGDVDKDDFKKYGDEGFAQLKDSGKDWVKEAAKGASDYQKRFIGYVYAATGSKKKAREAWEDIQKRGDMIWQTVNGKQSIAGAVGDFKGELYGEYSDLSNSFDLPDWLTPWDDEEKTAARAVWDIYTTTIAQAPQLAAQFVPGVGRILGAAVMAVPAYGREYKAAVDQGYDPRQAAGYAATQAAMEFGTDYLLTGIGSLGGKLTGDVGLRFVKNISNPFVRALADTGIRSFGEGAQEYLQEVLTNPIRNLWFQEENAFEPISQEAAYSFFLGAMSAALMSPASMVGASAFNHKYVELGKALNEEGATSKLIDMILNNPVETTDKNKKALYDEAKKLAEKIKSGKVKASDLNAGEAFVKYGQAGGDVRWLTDPATAVYNKQSLTREDLLAGTTSMLTDLKGNMALAGPLVSLAMGEEISQDLMDAIENDAAAIQVLSQLLGDLDMSQDTALSRAASASTRGVSTGNKVYETLKAENPDKTVATPVSQQLYAKGVAWEEANQISSVLEKVMNGEQITEDDAELISVDNAIVRSVILGTTGIELSESMTIGAVMNALNDYATNMATIRAQQADIKNSAEQVAKARMPIPPNNQNRTIGGDLGYSHDEFIRDYMNKYGVSQEQAEQAWLERQKVDRALFGNNGEEDNGAGAVSGNEGGRDTDLASGGTVSTVQSGEPGSGQPANTGAENGPGGKAKVREGSRGRDVQREKVITKYNAKQRDFVRAAKDAGFNNVTLVKGPITLTDSDGNPILKEDGTPATANAVVDSNGNLKIQWDCPFATPLKIMEHEKVHLWLEVLSPSGRVSYVTDAIHDILDEETLNRMIEIYSEQYAAAYAGLSEQAFMNAICEEIFADMYAGLDLYKAGTDAFQDQAQMFVAYTGLQDQFMGGEAATETTLPGRFDLADPFRESTDWEIPADARPFPGEEPMHTQLDRFSLSSMAEGGGFELELSNDGYPYALIDKATGERVTEVTPDMMIGTPLGDLVQMAVDNDGIDENEAKAQRKMLADAMNLIVKYNDAAVVWELAGSQLFSAIKSNSDTQYNKTIDFSTICKKTMAIVDAMSETMKRLGRGLTRREVEAVYYETGNAGEATPCPVCYVFSRWMGIGNLLDQMSRFQDVYAGKSEEELVSFMADIEDQARAYAEAASESKKKDFYDKNGNLKIGKVISDMKSKPNSRAASAIKKLNQHQQANNAIVELQNMIGEATPEQAARWKKLIKTLQRNVLTDEQIQELQDQMAEADSEVEVFEVYQWLAKTVLKSDSQVDENGDAIGNWKKNPDFKPVPKDILFDLNRGGDFSKDYPLSWAFRTGKGCAMGKAITPYADARVGETIQGVALTDVKTIRVGPEINEFLNGDTKKQQQTLESARKKQKQQNLIGGMRYQSTSDFRYEFGSDYLMTFFEMQALGANVQLYTKVIEAVDFLASTGADCNLSVMPLGDGYVIDPVTGKKKLVFSNVTGINAEAAIKKAKEYDNVQLILVGINDENIRLALEGTDVTFVIPFHGSGQSVHQVQTLMDLLGEHLDVTQAQDYTSVQSDHPLPMEDATHKGPGYRTAEQKAMWDLRMAIIMGECENGLTAEQQALLDKNQHLQKLYDMFYVDETAPAYQNYLAKAQAEHIFPYEYWNREGDYEHADENGRTFQEYCKSMGIIPRFSGLNSKGEPTGFGDFTNDKGYWKLLIDRSMYENVYDQNGEWIGYGKYRDQQQINMSDVKLSDLDPKTGEAQFTNGEMSKQYDATHNEQDRQNLDTIVTKSIQRIEAMRDKGDVFDRTQVSNSFRKNIMEADSAIRERASLAPNEENTIYIKDGHYDNGETINFIDAILDGQKKGETRTHKSMTRNWVGLGKDGQVYGRARFGEPQVLEKGTQEYRDSMIEGTEYDLKDGETKYYYPVLETEDFRDNPKPITRNGNYGQYNRYSVAPEEEVPVISPEAAQKETEDTDVRFSIRPDDPPKKTKIGYKVFKAFKDDKGQLYPTKVDNPGGQGTPLGVWLNADTGELARNKDGSIKTNSKGRIKVKADGGELAWRPGWHLGELPEANQMNRNDPNNPGADRVSEGVMHDNYIFCECEFAADEDYQLEAFQMGFNEKGGYAHSQAGLPYIPKDGYYKYRTNPDPNTAPWYISGAIKITKILDDNMRREVIERWNAEHPDEPPMRVAPRYNGRDIDLSEYGFTAGPVTPTEELDSIAPGVDYSDEIKNLPGYKPNEINWGNASFQDAFRINGIEDRREELRQKYESSRGRYSVSPEDTSETTKKNPYKEGSMESMVFDMLNKANSPQELQDWINDLRQKQADNQANRTKPPVIPSADKAKPVNKEQRKIQENQLQKLIEKYGVIKAGEKPARGVSFPQRVSEERRTRQYARTAAEAEGVPQRMAERIGGELLTSDLLSYVQITDDAAIARANKEYGGLGYKKAIKEWETKSATNHVPTKYDIAFGAKLLVEATRQGDDATAMRVLADVSAMETQAGQVVQAARLLKKLGPSGQLYYVQKAVDRLNHQNEGRIAKGKLDPIIINQDLAKAVMLAETQEDMDKAMDALLDDIASKLPITLKDRWDAWRYLSMLGNPRTHVRNFFGNVFFMPARFMKDVMSAAGEKMIIRDQSQRTKNFGALMKSSKYKSVREFAQADFEEMRPQITGTGKLNPINEIMDRRKVLPGKLLNKISGGNDWLLNQEDVWAMKKAYVSALTQFIAARGLDINTLSTTPEGEQILNEARRYAVLEAQKATYRDFSLAAMKLNQWKRGDGFGSWLLDGIVPFTKTPINILKRGFEYSPGGLVKSLTYDLNRMRNGDITAAEAIDHVSAGLTGTGIAVLGWLLASIGVARGGPDDDDKKDDLEKAQGHQNYSLEYGGKSFTIDWMAPVALPFFLGVQAYKELSNGTQGSFFDFVNAMTMIAEPMTSLSMLDGINSTLAAVRQGDKDAALQSVMTNALASYVSQGVPTFLGQIARTMDPDRRASYVDKNSEVSPFLQRFAQNVQGKIPGLESQKMAYIDTWGRKDTNESRLFRAIENFILPGYLNTINETVVDSELLRLADSLGDTSVLPAEVAKYFQVEGETLNLTAKQYEKYKMTTGKTAFKLLGDLFSSRVYAAMGDKEKAEAVEQAMKISTAIGKQDVAPTYKTDGWIQRAIDHDNLENAAMFHMLKGLDTDLSNYQLISAIDWMTDREKGELVMEEHPNTYREMTDYTKRGYKFTLTDEQIEREREIYESMFWKEYNKLVNSKEYRKASVAKQAALLKDLQKDLGTKARKKLGNELRKAGIKSHKPSDAGVPKEVANLYDLLNR